MILTKLHIKFAMSRNGGWSKRQLKLLGFNGFDKGWVKKAVGKEYSEETIKQFLLLKNEHLKQTT